MARGLRACLQLVNLVLQGRASRWATASHHRLPAAVGRGGQGSQPRQPDHAGSHAAAWPGGTAQALIANTGAALQHVKAVAEQFKDLADGAACCSTSATRSRQSSGRGKRRGRSRRCGDCRTLTHCSTCPNRKAWCSPMDTVGTTSPCELPDSWLGLPLRTGSRLCAASAAGSRLGGRRTRSTRRGHATPLAPLPRSALRANLRGRVHTPRGAACVEVHVTRCVRPAGCRSGSRSRKNARSGPATCGFHAIPGAG